MSDVPDLRTLLAEKATRPTSSITVPLDQAAADEVRRLEDELATVAADSPPKRMSAESPLKAKAREVEAARERMRASEVTFRFEALTHAQREQIRRDMGGRDEPDEVNLRAIAAMCVEPADATWEDFRDLRDKLGALIFDAIDEAANRASGAQWSVPFSSSASLILGTEN
jgi:hypothetical protein